MTSSSFSSTTFKIRSPLHIGQARISIRSFFTKIHHQSHFCDRGNRILLFEGIFKVLYSIALDSYFPFILRYENLIPLFTLILIYSPGLFTYIFCRAHILCRARILSQISCSLLFYFVLWCLYLHASIYSWRFLFIDLFIYSIAFSFDLNIHSINFSYPYSLIYVMQILTVFS